MLRILGFQRWRIIHESKGYNERRETMNRVILSLKNIDKTYGKEQVLHNISFDIEQGEICGLIGENGAGKTTLMRILLGLIRADKGEIESVSQHKIGSIIESPALYPNLTGRQHLQYYKTRFGLKTDITKMLELVHLPEPSWDRKVKNYSLGMKQRLSIAIALLDNPELIILDEPVNGLDPQGISDLRKMILNLRDQLGVTFLISSHILSELEFITDKYIIMKKGKILNVMSSKELANDLSEKLFLKTSANQILKTFLKEEGIVHFEQEDYLVVPEKEKLMVILEYSVASNLVIQDIYIKKERFEDYYLRNII